MTDRTTIEGRNRAFGAYVARRSRCSRAPESCAVGITKRPDIVRALLRQLKRISGPNAGNEKVLHAIEVPAEDLSELRNYYRELLPAGATKLLSLVGTAGFEPATP